VCLKEAASPEFAKYAHDVVANAAALAESLRAHGFDMVSGGTDNHLVLVDLRKKGITGKDLQDKLDTVNITLNKNAIPNDPEKPFVTSGVRIGTPSVTTRGMKEEDMATIAHFIKLAATDFDNQADYIRAGVTKLCDKYPLY
jgi:glycine hydroxymethyltransferase